MVFPKVEVGYCAYPIFSCNCNGHAWGKQLFQLLQTAGYCSTFYY